MNHTRPKNLNLLTIRFPLPAIVSIFHRLSGVALFLFIPFSMWVFHFSMTESGFMALSEYLHGLVGKLILWLLLIPFCYHLVAGLRHLLTDIHIGSTLKGGRQGAMLTFIISAILIILAGFWIW